MLACKKQTNITHHSDIYQIEIILAIPTDQEQEMVRLPDNDNKKDMLFYTLCNICVLLWNVSREGSSFAMKGSSLVLHCFPLSLLDFPQETLINSVVMTEPDCELPAGDAV